MSFDKAIVFRWDAANEVMRPTVAYRALCAERYQDGEAVRLLEEKQRSPASHAHYFATINDMWSSLPESLDGKYPSPEHLRKWALCRAGYADERYIVCDTLKEARKVAAFVRSFDDFAVIRTEGEVVRVYHAKSQSAHAMGGQEFQKSKEAVLGIIQGLLDNRESAEQAVGAGPLSGLDRSQGEPAPAGDGRKASPALAKRAKKRLEAEDE